MRIHTSRRWPASVALVLALTAGAAARAGQPASRSSVSARYVEVKACRPPEEEGEFLQSCVKIASGRRAGKLLGAGVVAPGGQAAAVLSHRRYGGAGDRVTVKVYGPDGRLEASYPMGAGGEEFALVWAPAPARYLGWIEVDGRGGVLRVVDRRRQRVVLTAISPLEEWPVFAPRGARVLVPRASAREATPRAPGEGAEEPVRELEVQDLAVKGSRRVVLRAGAGEELTAPRWGSPTQVTATLRKVGASKGKPVQAQVPLPAPPAPPPPAAEE